MKLMPRSGEKTRPSGPRGHSEVYFGSSRDFWWNADYLELTARRLNWGERRRVLEVGCGTGHWTRALVRFLAPGASVTCVDRDPKWSDPAQEWVKSLNASGAKVAVVGADACSLPFPDGAFDFVTCQTLLLHVSEPGRALAEMVRVLEPGGLLLCVEPDNFAPYIAGETSLSRTNTLDEETASYRFAAAQARGRIARGVGNYSIGGRLPGMFSALGLNEISVRLSDRTLPLFPPYSGPQQSAFLADIARWHESSADFDREEVRKNFLAGGGSAAEFDSLWAQDLARRKRFFDSVANRTYDEAGGSLFYVVSGIKPEQVP